jgi:hypothetical protein
MGGLIRKMKMVFLRTGKAVFGALLVVTGAGIITFIFSPEFRMGVDRVFDALPFVGYSPASLFFIAESLLIVLGGMLFMCGMWFLFLAVATESLNLCCNGSMPRPSERNLELERGHAAGRVEIDKRWFKRIEESEKAILDAAPPPKWLFWAPALRIAQLAHLRDLREKKERSNPYS